MMTLAEYFQTHLSAEMAVSRKQRNDAHRIRYSVYCEERGYEDPCRFPDMLERDEHDDGSVQAIVRHRRSHRPLGVVRLVLPDHSNPAHQFPIEQHFGHTFNEAKLRAFGFNRKDIAEVSRFAISKHALKYLTELSSEDSLDIASDRRSSKLLVPHISLGLIAMLFHISHKHRVRYWYAAMEPSLSRLLTRLGIRFTQIGPIMDYHGKRQPMIAKVDTLLHNIYHERRDFYNLIKQMGGTATFERQQAHVWSQRATKVAVPSIHR